MKDRYNKAASWFGKLLILSFSIMIVSCAHAEQIDYHRLFDDLLAPAPEVLSIDYLKSLPKFRCIHHDGFDRLKIIPIDPLTGRSNVKYSLANDTSIGKNSLNNENSYGYEELATNNVMFHVGVQADSLAINSVNGESRQKLIKYVDTERSEYGFVAKRSSSLNSDVKVAFRIIDIDNYYYARLTRTTISLYRVKRGRTFRIMNTKTNEGAYLNCYIASDTLHLYVNFCYVKSFFLNSFSSSTKCGLLFQGNEKSEVDDFEINYLDDYDEVLLDKSVENGIIDKRFGGIEAEAGLLTASSAHTFNSNFSIRFQLDYYTDWESHKIANARRTEFSVGGTNHSSLDSWMCSFDVYFPGKNDGDEYYLTDELDELFWQFHAPLNIDMLSPNVALYLQNDYICFQILTRKILRNDRKGCFSNRTGFNLDGIIAKLVDETSNDSNKVELKKGRWHNFTIYCKEGYSLAHIPRSIVYINEKKVIDWFVPNMQNCGMPPSYMKIGIYKWAWKNSQIDSEVRRRVIYFDNLLYCR